jgi:hypothetical protein
MSNYLYIPLMNPVNFYEVDPVELPQYLSRNFDDYAYRYTVKPWEEPVSYCQKFQKSDIINLQFISNFDPISVSIITEHDQTLTTQAANPVRQDKFRPGYFAYQVSFDLDDVPEGVYYFKLLAGGSAAVMISEPILVKEIHLNTIYLQYKNSRYHTGVLFETGIEFNFRVEGSLGHVTPSSRDQFYDDQRYNPTILSSKPFDNYPLSIGGSWGVPDWVIQKINYIFSCNNVMIDGKLYAKTSDSRITVREEDQYPLRGIEFTVRQGLNRGYKVISPDVDVNQRILIVHSIDSQLFGGIPGGTGTIQVIDLE